MPVVLLVLQPTLVDGESDRIPAAVHAERVEDFVHMVFHRVHREAEATGDLLVALPVGDQMQDLELARGELERIELLAPAARAAELPEACEEGMRDARRRHRSALH